MNRHTSHVGRDRYGLERPNPAGADLLGAVLVSEVERARGIGDHKTSASSFSYGGEGGRAEVLAQSRTLEVERQALDLDAVVVRRGRDPVLEPRHGALCLPVENRPGLGYPPAQEVTSR